MAKQPSMPMERIPIRTSSQDANRDAIAVLGDRSLLRNTGIPLNLDWVREVRVNTSAVERRAQSQVARRTVKKEWQAAWLLRAITCMDLTTLSGDDTDERVRRLCAKARHPIQQEVEQKLGIEDLHIKVAAVCVYHTFVETALQARWKAAEFTLPPSQPDFRRDYRRSLNASRRSGARLKLERTRSMWSSPARTSSAAAGRRSTTKLPHSSKPADTAHMKVILGTGDLLTLRNVARASVVAMMAGADFIKTSTGKEPTNATLPVGLVMTRAIREYAQQTGMAVGFKPAGGIRTAKQSLEWLAMIKEELGPVVAASRNVPLRGERLAGRYRAATGASCDRTVLRGVPASDGVSAENSNRANAHEHC